MFSLVLVPIFIGLTAVYFLVKSYYLRTVYVIKPTKTVPRSSCDINDAHRLIQIIRARRESQTSLSKYCSSSSLDDLSEVVSDLEPGCQLNNVATKYDNIFTTDHIPDLNSWLESSTTTVPSNDPIPNEEEEASSQPSTANRSSLSAEGRTKSDQTSRADQTSRPETVKYLNLDGEQLTGKQLQILTSLSYLVNEERLSIMICKLKLPFFKSLCQQPPFQRRANLSTNQNYFKVCQQLELIRRTKFIFVKTYLIDSATRKRISKKKSSLLSVDGHNCILNNNPYDQSFKYLIINELMIFKLPINQLSKITIRLTVLGLSSLSHLKEQLNQSEMRNKKIKRSLDTLYSFGYVEIGCNSLSKSAFLHYQNLLNNMRKPVCMWHSLDLSKQTKRKSSISS